MEFKIVSPEEYDEKVVSLGSKVEFANYEFHNDLFLEGFLEDGNLVIPSTSAEWYFKELVKKWN